MQYIPDAMSQKDIEGPPEQHLRAIDKVLGATIQEILEAARDGTDLSEIAGPEDREAQKAECVICLKTRGALCAKCDKCGLYVHTECDEELKKRKRKEIEEQEEYTCPKCRPQAE